MRLLLLFGHNRGRLNRVKKVIAILTLRILLLSQLRSLLGLLPASQFLELKVAFELLLQLLVGSLLGDASGPSGHVRLGVTLLEVRFDIGLLLCHRSWFLLGFLFGLLGRLGWFLVGGLGGDDCGVLLLEGLGDGLIALFDDFEVLDVVNFKDDLWKLLVRRVHFVDPVSATLGAKTSHILEFH